MKIHTMKDRIPRASRSSLAHPPRSSPRCAAAMIPMSAVLQQELDARDRQIRAMALEIEQMRAELEEKRGEAEALRRVGEATGSAFDHRRDAQGHRRHRHRASPAPTRARSISFDTAQA